jgi:outer membrane cobalamin receptor
MKTLKLTLGIAAVSMAGIGISAAEPLAQAVNGQPEKVVFVTGSYIPQRVKIKAIGTDTTSPVRVYTRAEIDRTGQFQTDRILAQDPSIRIGH